jgi:hypothetical protein
MAYGIPFPTVTQSWKSALPRKASAMAVSDAGKMCNRENQRAPPPKTFLSPNNITNALGAL